MKKIYFSLILLCLSCLSLSAFAQTTTSFTYTGSVQTYTVPLGVSLIKVDMAGAKGADFSSPFAAGGAGGRIVCTINVTPLSVFYAYVGQAGTGGSCGSGGTGGGNSGGGAIGGNGSPTGCGGSGGGGATDIRTVAGSSPTSLATRVVVAGAGGGGAWGCSGDIGGAGGGTTGGTGTNCGSYNSSTEGTPGSTTGGAAGSYVYTASPGGLGYGGNASNFEGGGGGAGYYGAGGADYGGGCGGSSYANSAYVASGTPVQHTQGFNTTGNGYIAITVLCNAPGTITGSSSVCFGGSTTLSNPTGASGGTWSSSATGVATINSTSGLVTAVSPGTTTITYNVSNPCGSLATFTLTVNPAISVSGAPNVCTGNTRTLTPSPTGGTFSSSSSVISVGGSSGVISGIATGTATITYTLPSGCSTTLPFTVNGTPSSITGTTTLCAGATSTLSDLTSGGTWASSDITKATVGSSSGTVTGVAAGSPSIVYTAPTGCTTSIGLTINNIAPLTGLFGVCNGSTTTISDAVAGGVWTSSNPAIATIGSSTGLVTSVSSGTSIIVYTLPSGCSASATFGVSSSPSVFTVSGGGVICSGATGSTISLSGSGFAVSYQLYNGVTAAGAPVVSTSSTGVGFSFPPQTTAGTYTVVANPGTSCSTTMSGSATITVNPLPTQYNMTGGTPYCAGGSGTHIGLSSSQTGVTYNLLNSSSTTVSTVAGTGGAIDFGLVTTVGTYTAIGTNTTTGCVNTMNGTITVTTNPLPVTTYTLTGTGGFCAGGSGLPIGLNPSDAGISYQLYLSGTAVGSPVGGSGGSISFGTYTTGGTYTVVATNTVTGCTSTLTSTATVSVNALPTVYTVTGGGAYCSGATTGVAVGLGGSTSGINYQLYNAGVAVSGALVPGTGSSITFGGVFSGAYTVTATNPTTGCAVNMASSVLVTVNPLPTSFSVTGGGNYCAGGVGMHVGLSGSVIGTNYQLYIGTLLVGGASGSSGALDFGLQLTAGTYTVIATNGTTGCTNSMTGSVTIAINPLPIPYTVTGGGSYCAGATLGAPIGLSNSTSGVNYQLYNGVTLSGGLISGSGAAISFGSPTAAGSYTAVAINASTGCSIAMLGSAVEVINPLPTVYNVTGGGAYCAGGTGVHVGVAATNSGISYQLFNGSAVGIPLSGSGASLDFGLETVTGTYTVVATNAATTCTAAMAGNAIVTTTPLPTAYTVSVTGSGAYCAGSAAPHAILSSSNTGISYQLLRGTTTVGSPLPGTNLALDFSAQATAGTYTVVATNTTTGCTNNMTGSATVVVNPLPAVYNVTGGGSYCATTTGVHVGLNNSASGINYQLYNGPALAGGALAGSGTTLDLGVETAAGAYTVIAINPVTSCTVNMFGNAVVSVNALPAVFPVTGGGNYCFGGTGVHIGVGSSVLGTNYQLYRGGTTAVGAPLAGIGSALDFGLQTTAGTYTIVATNATTGCTATMTGAVAVNVVSLPTIHNVIGSGSYCPGGSGRHVDIDGSDIGISYQLYNGTTPVTGAVLSGTGSSLDFGSQTAGSYTIIGTSTLSGCTNNMAGIATITIAPLPTVYTVTGGGNYCPGTTGVHVGLNGSNTGINYQLVTGGSGIGAARPGTGLAIDFGLITTTGVYTIVATNATTTCNDNMAGSVTVSVNPLPASHTVTGGGNYCAGSTGVDVGLDGSTVGTNYQLFNGSTTVGTIVAGTGSALDFGIQTTAGTYTVVANNVSTTCNGNMAGAATIVVNPLPDTFSITGGGTYCIGTTGADIGLAGSVTGISYQLYNGTAATGSAVAGTGSNIDFGPQTAAGNYTVVATNVSSLCTNNMPGSTNVTIGALPLTYTVGGGGSLCAGGTGVPVTLAGSNTGVTYQLYKSGSPIGTAIAGTGSAINFGAQTLSGGYTVMATDNTTHCVNNMTGTATVAVNPLPVVHTVGSVGSTYCVGGPGVDITLNGSEVGVSYQLLHGTTVVGTQLGTGAPLDFGYLLPTGAYTAVAINSSTGCTNNMAGSVAIAVTPLPTVYTVTGGGNYCSGGTGSHVDLSGSATGVSYQLLYAGTPVGSPVAGTGSSIDFGAYTGSGAYTVVATNTFTTCTNNMSGTATIGISPLPSLYAVTGGGNYCAGGTGSPVNLGGSNTGISYQLFRGSTSVGAPVSGTGSVISFGLQTVPAIYTIVATNTSTGCTNNMIGSVAVGINPAPTAYTLTGGGNYCAGAAGVHIGITGSHTGVTYQVYDGTSAVGSIGFGSGSALDLGIYSVAGTYTVIATDGTTMCTASMSGTATVSIDPLPAVFTVTGGGSYCAAGAGVHIGLNGSVSGTNYQLFNGFTSTGSAVPGAGGILDLGAQTAAGTYTVVAISGAGCTSNMTGSATVVVNPNVNPIVHITSPSGDTVCSGDFITFSTVTVNGGSAPTYQWSVNGVNAGTNSTYGYIPANGDVISVQLTSDAACASPAVVNNAQTIYVNTKALPLVSITSSPGNEVCSGNSVTFSATSSYGGNAPVYSWFKNTANVSSGPTFTYNPLNGDNIYCVLTSDYGCRLANTASSNHETMIVDVPTTPTVTITTIPGGNITPGEVVTIEATVTNGISSPSFQWYVNGVAVTGATSPVLTRTFSNMDSVSCEVTTTGGCAGITGSGSVTIHIANVGVTQVAAATGDIQLVPNPNKGTFTVKGSLAAASNEEVTIEVTDMIGKVLYTGKAVTHNGEINEKIQLNNLANGMYILSVHADTENKVFHMVIEQ